MKKIFKNKTVIISGGSTGIGRAVALHLAQAGANISFSYFKSKYQAEVLRKELCALKIKTKAYHVDIKSFESVSKWVQASKRYFGEIDAVINNAGIFEPYALAFTSKYTWKKVIDTNLGGVFNLSQSVITDFMKRKKGVIINIVSLNAIIGGSPTNYVASKSGIIGFTKSLAREVSKYNIRVNAIAPGYIDTEMIKHFNQDHRRALISSIPLGRLGYPDDVAKLVKFLVSNESSYITGQTIIIDGGFSMVL
ncbi:MAG: SDR family oxidoreductase [Candidatus Omnitrophota bacterium]|jgi:3-oxoacyl-[acyl-carrier protein] reductase|nr:MAG: SDR family oxidoreductase [Candidatus Omnitrophota bacterium]